MNIICVTIQKQMNLDGSEEVRIEIDHIVSRNLVINTNVPIQSTAPWQELPALAVKSPVPTSEEGDITPDDWC